MKHFIGLNVSMKETSVCVIDESGTIIRENSLPTDPDILGTYITKLGLSVELIGLESGSLSLVNRGVNLQRTSRQMHRCSSLCIFFIHENQ